MSRLKFRISKIIRTKNGPMGEHGLNLQVNEYYKINSKMLNPNGFNCYYLGED